MKLFYLLLVKNNISTNIIYKTLLKVLYLEKLKLKNIGTNIKADSCDKIPNIKNKIQIILFFFKVSRYTN